MEAANKLLMVLSGLFFINMIVITISCSLSWWKASEFIKRETGVETFSEWYDRGTRLALVVTFSMTLASIDVVQSKLTIQTSPELKQTTDQYTTERPSVPVTK